MNSRTRLTSANEFAAASAPAPGLRRQKPIEAKAKPAAKSERPSPSSSPSSVEFWLDPLIKFFSSLKLTVVCLGLGMVLVFWGTLAQVELGLFKAQNEFFRSFFIYWGPKTASWKIPIFPGGYLVGGVLLINLVTAHFKRFRFSSAKVGIWMVHFGLILLLLGQLLTDVLSRE